MQEHYRPDQIEPAVQARWQQARAFHADDGISKAEFYAAEAAKLGVAAPHFVDSGCIDRKGKVMGLS